MQVRTRVVAPGRAPVKPSAVSLASRRQMAGWMRNVLVQAPARGQFSVLSKRFGRAYVEYRRLGRATCVVLWLRELTPGPRRQARALTLLVGGSDARSDARAMAVLRRLAPRLPYPPELYRDVEREPRPAALTLLFARNPADEHLVSAAADAFAAAFYAAAMSSGRSK